MAGNEHGFIRIVCECGVGLEVSASMAGQTVRCEACGREIAVPFPQEAERAWYYIKDNQQVGPLPESGMQGLFDTGTLGAETLVWSEPMKDWASASDVETFRVKASPVRPSQGMSTTRIVLLAVIPVIVIIMLAVFGIGAAITLPALAKARESARRSACCNNLKQMGLIILMFAAEHKDMFPRIDDVKGNLMFEGDQVYPEYLRDVSILGCPSDPGYESGATFRLKDNELHPGLSAGDAHPDCITCESYIYLGWVVTNEEEGLAAIEAYRNATVAELNDVLRVPEGKGNNGGSYIRRLRMGVDRFFVTDVREPIVTYNMPVPSTIPVMWEWPTNHIPAGGAVLYLDGHVEFIRYPGKFPMTERFIEALRKFNPQFSPDVLPIVDK